MNEKPSFLILFANMLPILEEVEGPRRSDCSHLSIGSFQRMKRFGFSDSNVANRFDRDGVFGKCNLAGDEGFVSSSASSAELLAFPRAANGPDACSIPSGEVQRVAWLSSLLTHMCAFGARRTLRGNGLAS